MTDEKNPKLTLEKWLQLTDNGIKIPVTTKLNGESMTPLIRKNRDVVTVIPINEQLKVGQIVIFKVAENICIAHRIYKISDDFVVTFGDNCDRADKPVDKNMLVGIVSSVQRGGRNINLNCTSQFIYGRLWMHVLRYFWKAYKIIHKKLKSKK